VEREKKHDVTNENIGLTELCDAFLLLETREEAYNFLKDLCTPQEITTLTERWRVCQLLEKGDLSYREIHRMTSASLTTIGRVARFLKDESYHGYRTLLEKTKKI
jgi:TrpR-related protein YerC/YecD